MVWMSRPPAATSSRRRGAALTHAIYVATLQELAESSLAELTFEKIAARAGAGKTSLYRRWSSPAELLRAALTDETTGVPPVVEPATGSVRDDLMTALAVFAQALVEPYGRALAVLMNDAQRHPELTAEVHRMTVQPRIDLLLQVLRAGVARGEVDDGAATPRVAAVGMQLVIMAYVELGSVPAAEVEAIVDEVLVPLVRRGR